MPMSISSLAATHPCNTRWDHSQCDVLSTQSRPAQSNLKKRTPTLLRYGRRPRLLFLLWCGLSVFALSAQSQTAQEEPLPGPDSHETCQGPHGHLFGDWSGE